MRAKARLCFYGDAAATSAARIPADEIQRNQHHQNNEDDVLQIHSKKLQYRP